MGKRSISTETEVLIIGSGPGGYVAAIRSGQLGLDAVLVDREAHGGTCLNHGCIPSKALITATDLFHRAGNAEEMGIHGELSIDVERMIDWKDSVVDQLTQGVEKLCRANRIELAEGTVTFLDEHRAQISREDDQDELEIEFDNAIIATGSRPIQIPGFDFADEPVLSSRDVLGTTEVPDSIVIVGAGYIGMELAGVLAKIGTDVTVIEMLNNVLPGYDADLVRPVKRHAESLGVEFNFGESASGWRDADSGIEVTTENEAGEEHVYATDAVLVAVGRQPVTDTLNLESIDIELTDRGFLQTNDRAQTEFEHVFAVGDVAGEPMLAHKASVEGVVAAEVIAGEGSRLEYEAIPAAVFTEPEIGTVGVTPDAAAERGLDPVVGEFPFRASGRALTTGSSDGFVRIVADSDGTVVGGQVVGPEASELIAEIGLAVEMSATLEDVGTTIHSHPTLSESVMEAAENGLGRAIHTLNR